MNDLLWALRLERERIQRAIRNLERDLERFGGPTQRADRVTPIRRDILASDEVREVADLAYDIWLSNGFWGGSPEDALIAAVQQSRTTATSRLSLVPKRKSNVQPFPPLRFHSN